MQFTIYTHQIKLKQEERRRKEKKKKRRKGEKEILKIVQQLNGKRSSNKNEPNISFVLANGHLQNSPFLMLLEEAFNEL